jgi:endoglucanase
MKRTDLLLNYLKENRIWNKFGFSMLLLFIAFGIQSNVFSQSFLSASGKKMVNSSGQEVILRGVNLGGWVLQEGYLMCPTSSCGVGTQWQMKKKYYDAGQTDAQVEAFYQSWRDNFITQADINYIASLGFNCVRLPMHYELFLTPSQRAVRNSVIRNSGNYGTYLNSLNTWYNSNQIAVDASLEGFKIIDKVISWCSAKGIYVILDMHAAPGAQGNDANISDALYGNNLWTNGWVYQNILNRMWEKISARYKSNSTVAFYDLINEPNQIPSQQDLHSLYQRLINTIRNQGDNHMLMIEGDGWGNNYNYNEPFTFSPNWGLVYNAHRYWINEGDDWVRDGNPNQINRMINLIEFRDRHNVPVWVGETGENNSAWLKQNVDKLNNAGIGWCHWTYKRWDVNENSAVRRIPGSWPTDGAGVMSAVLNNMKFASTIENTNTVNAIRPPAQIVCTTPPASGSVIWLQNSSKYVSSNNGTKALTCDRASAGGWEKFTLVTSGNKFSLLGSNSRYVSSENGAAAMTCTRTAIGGWEQFEWCPVPGSSQIAIKGSNGLYVCSDGGATTGMMCNRSSVSGWEAFSWAYSTKSASIELSVEEEIQNNDLVVYPNPASTYIKLKTGLSNYNVEIYDFQGRLVLQATINGNNEIGISSLKPGLYVVRANDNINNFTQKLEVR